EKCDESIRDFVRRSVHQADLVKVRACLTAGSYRPAHKKSDTSVTLLMMTVSEVKAPCESVRLAGCRGDHLIK
ncbi:hypothetical protein, partial [Pseudomonas mosselii]|uniref:hypothetical protein n=1 Tax=Pseudomonas mosselii TaxID=78327 RepID=UPI001C714A30